MAPSVDSPVGRQFALGALLLTVLLTTSPWRFPQVSDGEAMLATAESLLYRRTLAVDSRFLIDNWLAPSARLGADGRAYSKYGIGFPLVEVPVLAGADVVADVLQRSRPEVRGILLSLLNPLLAVLSCLLVVVISRRLGASVAQARALAASCALATLIGHHATSDAADVLLAVLVTGAVAALAAFASSRALRAALMCGALLGYAVLTKPVMLAVVPAFALGVLAISWRGTPGAVTSGSIRSRITALVVLIVPVGVAVATTLWMNALRFGSPLTSGYNTPVLTGDVATGLFGLTLGFNKGLVWYAPLAVLGAVACLRRRVQNGPVLTVTLLAAASLALATARFYDWGGGWSWGPRYLLPVVPALVACCATLFASRPGRAALGAATGLGAIVSLLGLLISEDAYRRTTLSVWMPEVSGTVRAGVTSAPGQIHDVLVPVEDVVPAFSSIAGHYWLLRVALRRCDCSESVWWCACAAGDLSEDPVFGRPPWSGRFPAATPSPPYGISVWRPALLSRAWRAAVFDPADVPPPFRTP